MLLSERFKLTDGVRVWDRVKAANANLTAAYQGVPPWEKCCKGAWCPLCGNITNEFPKQPLRPEPHGKEAAEGRSFWYEG